MIVTVRAGKKGEWCHLCGEPHLGIAFETAGAAVICKDCAAVYNRPLVYWVELMLYSKNRDPTRYKFLKAFIEEVHEVEVLL